MRRIIRTKYEAHPVTGTGRIIATGGGKRLVIPYDHARGRDAHEDAALKLAARLGWGSARAPAKAREGYAWAFKPSPTWTLDARNILRDGVPVLMVMRTTASGDLYEGTDPATLAPSCADDLCARIVDALNATESKS